MHLAAENGTALVAQMSSAEARGLTPGQRVSVTVEPSGVLVVADKQAG